MATARPGVDVFLLSAGAASGFVTHVAQDFERRHRCALRAEFGAVGAMRERLQAGAPCDAIILSLKLMDALERNGQLVAGSVRKLGRVRTAVAVIHGDAPPAIGDAAAFAQALRHARGLYLPDMTRATAGIHMRKVLADLGVLDEVRSRIHEFPNGAAAMRAMAERAERGSIGCTQLTEILPARGIAPVGPLPDAHGLETPYTMGVPRRAARPDLGQALIDHLADTALADARRAAGFE